MSKLKPDEYYNNELFELARFGNTVYSKNKAPKPKHSQIINYLKEKYEEYKLNINNKIDSIKKDILICDPIELLQFSSDIFKLQGMQFINHEDFAVKLPEERKPYIATVFIQSVYVSSPMNQSSISDNDKSELFFKIISDIEELIDMIQLFYFSWGAKIKEIHPSLDDDISKLLIEEQSLFLVNGNRYQIFEKEYHELLLIPHNDIFLELFNMSSKEIIDGMQKIQCALSQQKFDSLARFSDLFDKFENEYADTDIELFHSENKDELALIAKDLLGESLCDVKHITNWPQNFIDELSWEINSCPEFWNGEYGGWPIIDLPTSKRPFIKVNNKSYCFDYYSFVDNFYRSVQKATTRIKNYQWSTLQQSASEKMVSDIFKKLLPECTIYSSNYYPKYQSLKQPNENDIIVIYDNTLIIIEVKAGSFVYTSPISDFDSHIKSYKKLIEEADIQCQRTKEYLKRNDIAKIYNQDKSLKAEIDMSAISTIYMMSVTIDNINAFAAKADKLKFLKLQSNAISIAVDDLMVYREYFDSPLVFLHFLKQRSLATQNSNLALNDELDHLGMYIEHNCYNYQTKDIKKGTEIFFMGYRDDLNLYFSSLYHPELTPKKPVQELPALFMQILNYLDSNKIPNRSLIANYFLDFSSEAKNDFCKSVFYLLKRQKETHASFPFMSSGKGDALRFTTFVNQAPYEISMEKQINHTLATLSWNKEDNRALIVLTFKNDEFVSIYFNMFKPDDINDQNRDKIIKLGEQNARKRLLEYKKSNPGKIGRNSLCPCGSGKKYKKCCGA